MNKLPPYNIIQPNHNFWQPIGDKIHVMCTYGYVLEMQKYYNALTYWQYLSLHTHVPYNTIRFIKNIIIHLMKSLHLY